MTDHMKLGKRIRDARRQRRLTLERVASMTGLSVGFLSQVERNITKPSLASLALIAQSLEMTVSGLLQESDLPISVSRREGRIAYQIKDEAGSYERLSTSFPTQLLSAVKLYLPSALRSKVFSYDGELIVYVLGGTIRYVIEGVIYELQSGDSLHFSTSKPHWVATPSDSTAEILVLSTQQVVDDYHRISQHINVLD
ncbi:transcriptional regulator, XRE family with cupin sensor [Kaistia soli DSM 19436]|uniref:Transcriptional regulator, XRE family with cupin sensor n=2 Tax=Kaistia TaxID=166953 RepID=A0A1M5NKL4_9HYPH|nr:transcriptional regulator, XRE family with cupin sensor [Kaistia soli DSM 19436]